MAPRQKALSFSDFSASDTIQAGLDEAGRGCLAGPVAAAAVILPAVFNLPGLTDSKLLSAARRVSLATQIKQCAVWSIALVWPERIKEINILQASLEAMAKAAANLQIRPSVLLIDGNTQIPMATMRRVYGSAQQAPIPDQKTFIKGDRLIPAISAASIIAKTFRDRLMHSLDKKWPGYGLSQHKGYGTKMHLQALRALGPTPIHRADFRGVKDADTPYFTQDSLLSCVK